MADSRKAAGFTDLMVDDSCRRFVNQHVHVRQQVE